MVQVRQTKLIMAHLLDLASAKKRAAESISVAAAVQQAVETMPRPLTKDRIELGLSVPADLSVTAQPGLLEQVLLNLLLNARQAMKPAGGKLTISATPDGTHVLIDVRDTGIGVSPERIEGVINPFLAGRDSSSRKPGNRWASGSMSAGPLPASVTRPSKHSPTMTAVAPSACAGPQLKLTTQSSLEAPARKLRGEQPSDRSPRIKRSGCFQPWRYLSS